MNNNIGLIGPKEVGIFYPLLPAQRDVLLEMFSKAGKALLVTQHNKAFKATLAKSVSVGNNYTVETTVHVPKKIASDSRLMNAIKNSFVKQAKALGWKSANITHEYYSDSQEADFKIVFYA